MDMQHIAQGIGAEDNELMENNIKWQSLFNYIVIKD